NLKEIGLGCLNYESVYKKLPPGALGPDPTNNNPATNPSFFGYPHVGVLAFLLPFIEQDNIYKQMSLNWTPKTLGTPWYGVGPNVQAAQYKIPIFICPADNAETKTAFVNVLMAIWITSPTTFAAQ